MPRARIEGVAHLRCDFFSEELSLSTSMTVILPHATPTQVGMAGRATAGLPPVLYLLHGLSDDDTTWLRRTSIERYVASLGVAVVMPQVHRSFYTDEAVGGRYWTFLSEELPALVSTFFRVSERRSDTFVAGLSMGGYGAMKWALQQPERFAAAASLSGALNISGLAARPRAEDPRLFDRVFGAQPVGGQDEVMGLIDRADVGRLPALYICCGTEDALLGDNLAFRDACASAKIPLSVDIGPGGHEWSYWDARIQDVLKWLPLSGDAG